MTFDDIFTLLIVVIFIGLPLLNRLMRGAAGRPGAPPPGAPGRPAAPRTQPPGQQPARPAPGAPTAADDERDDERRYDREDPMDELSRRLEEARRRVREAMGEETLPPSRDRPLVSEPPRGQTIASAGMPSGTVTGTMRPPPVAPPAPTRPPDTGRSAVSAPQARTGTTVPLASVKRTGSRPPGFARAQPALEVERSTGRGAAGSAQERQRRDRARGEAAALVSMDSASVRKGLLWHMILGQPAAFGRGRMRSPRPSR